MARDEVDPKLLESLGMTEQEFAEFVRKYESRLSNLRPAARDAKAKDGKTPDGDQTPGQAGTTKLQPGQTAAGELSGRTGGGTRERDSLRKLRESPRQRVSPKYREHVENYLRAISDVDAYDGKPSR